MSMSAWGTGIQQSDEFSDVYDEFFELYKDDAVATDLYQAILTEYQAEFSDEESSPMLYTVYYALAQCLWECGVKDDWLWRKIKDIIDTDADLKFWNQLGLEPQLEKSRRKALLKFWEKINSKPTKIKKPKINKVKVSEMLKTPKAVKLAEYSGFTAGALITGLAIDYVLNKINAYKADKKA